MKKITLLFLVLALLLCSCAPKVDYANVDLSKIEDVCHYEEAEWYIENTHKSLWKTNIEDYSNKQQIKLLNDLCFFEFPTNIELGDEFSFYLDDDLAYFNGSITVSYDDYKQIVGMLLENPHWGKVTENIPKRRLLGTTIVRNDSPYAKQITEWRNSENDEVLNNFEYFVRYVSPLKVPIYQLFPQEIMILPDESKNTYVIFLNGMIENYTNKYGMIGDYFKEDGNILNLEKTGDGELK